jgi:beta-phosphoglucomutase-like phosphatase (HAD superfamily)
MRYHGIIFDFNGVLLWDSHLQEQAWRQLSAELGRRPLSEQEYAVHVHGRNNQHTLEYLTGRSMHGDELARLSSRKEAAYRQLCLDQGPGFRLSPGAVDLLDFLSDHQIPRTIATASGKANLDFFVENLGLDRWFKTEWIVYDDGTRPGKPAPDIYHQAAGNLALDPARCIVVEDSRSGIQAAHNAGIGHIIALGPASTHGRLAKLAGVDAVVASLDQVPVERLLLV